MPWSLVPNAIDLPSRATASAEAKPVRVWMARLVVMSQTLTVRSIEPETEASCQSAEKASETSPPL